MAVELPPGYYLDNFVELLEYVFEQYEDLLGRPERQFYHRFVQCSADAQKLLVRMMTRKGEVFRRSKLVYLEIADTEAAACELAEQGLIEISTQLPPEDWLGLFNKGEWLGMLDKAGVDTGGLKGLKRAELDEAVLALVADGLPTLQLSDELYRLNNAESFETFKLLFFGNLEQDLTDFVLRDLGLSRYESYVIDRSTRLFDSAEQIAKHRRFYRLIADLEQVLKQTAEDIVALHLALPQPGPDDDTLKRRVQRVNLTLARQLERLERFDEALAIYRLCELPPARERQARIWLKLGEVHKTLALCQEMQARPGSDEEAVVGREFGWRTAKKYAIDWPAPSRFQPVSERMRLRQSGQGVEADVADRLSEQGACFFVENALFGGVFALHYWPVLFAPVRGAFTHPFQSRPHDLYDEAFVKRRRHLFDTANRALAQLSERPERYLDLWQQKSGMANPLASWEGLDEEVLALALERIPLCHWQAVFDRLWQDLRANRSGFPDLIWFPASGGYRLVEVKGPGDKLQKNQLRWLEFFAAHQIPHQVVYVDWDAES